MARFEKQRRTEPDEDDQKDGIKFDKLGRMKYNPDFHPNHGKPFTLDDLIYMCKFYEIDGPRKIAFALGKTEHTVMSKRSDLRKAGTFEQYKNISDEEWSKIAQPCT
jgi:hypothetical protein